MQKLNIQKSGKGYDFQFKAAEILGGYYDVVFREYAIPIGNPPKMHKFDLVSDDKHYIGECKNYVWTAGGNVPSAKICHINEAVFYLQHLPSDTIRFVVMRRAIDKFHLESLAEYYYRMNKHLLKGVIIIEIDETTENVIIVGVQDS
jgi:hypothetical protein